MNNNNIKTRKNKGITTRKKTRHLGLQFRRNKRFDKISRFVYYNN